MIWDTAGRMILLRILASHHYPGQEEYDRLRALSYPNATVFVMCFSVVQRSTYTNISTKVCALPVCTYQSYKTAQWIPELNGYRTVPLILVGTKADLRSSAPPSEVMSVEDGQALAKKIGALCYLECSAKTGAGIDKVFEQAALAKKGAKPGGKEESSGCKCIIL